MRRRRWAEIGLVVTVVIWSLNFTASKVGVDAFGPLAFSVVRFSVGASVTAAVVLAREGVPRFRRHDLGLLGVAAATGITINQASFVGALHFATASNVALLVGTIPIWTAVIAFASRQERPTIRQWSLLGLGLVGVALIVLATPHMTGATTILGVCLALVTAASWGLYSVLIGPLIGRYSAAQLSVFVMVAGTLMLLPFSIPDVLKVDWSAVRTIGWLALAYAAILSVSLTNLLYFTAIRIVGPSRAAMYTYLEPMLGVLFAVALLGERVTATQLAGGILIVAAVAFGRRPVLAEPGI